MRERLKRLWERALDLLYPPRCPFCRALLREKEKTVCAKCDASLPRTGAVGAEQKLANIEKCFSPLYYEGTVRSSLLRFKFGGLSSYSENYSEFMTKCIDGRGLSCDTITWVPISRARLRRRGYDQAMLLARGVSKRLGVGCEQLLVKIRNNPAQSGTGSREKRKKNVSGVYRVKEGASVAGRHILLVDDIVTTGATLSECARTLRSAGAASVTALTLARGK